MAEGARDEAEEEAEGEAMRDVTPTQRRYLDFIARYEADNGFTPTIRELCGEMGVKSTNAVNDVLKALERKGLIRRSTMKARSIVLTAVAQGSLPLRVAAFEALKALKQTAAISLEDSKRVAHAITQLARAGVR